MPWAAHPTIVGAVSRRNAQREMAILLLKRRAHSAAGGATASVSQLYWLPVQPGVRPRRPAPARTPTQPWP
jgi:hypothetical protein